MFGKTGTTDHDKTAALIAGTTSLVVAGYLVNPDYQDHPDRMSHADRQPGRLQYTLADYMKGKPKVQFKTPDNDKIAYGDQRSIPDVTCADLGAAQSRLDGAGFDVSVGNTVDSNCPAGTRGRHQPERPHHQGRRRGDRGEQRQGRPAAADEARVPAADRATDETT